MTTTTTGTERGHMGEMVRYFLRLGFLGFGRPVALVGQMEHAVTAVVGQVAYPILQPEWVLTRLK
jgi:hypothetical protein